MKAQDEAVRSEVDALAEQLRMHQYQLDTERMSMLFEVLAREINSNRSGAMLYGIAEKELKKIAG
jgi:hypothetical protein